MPGKFHLKNIANIKAHMITRFPDYWEVSGEKRKQQKLKM